MCVRLFVDKQNSFLYLVSELCLEYFITDSDVFLRSRMNLVFA